MSESISLRAATSALRVVDALRLRGALRWVFRHLPPSVRSDLGILQVRLGLMEGLIKVPEAALERSFEAAIQEVATEADGGSPTYLEFGVYVGTSMACMYRAASRSGATGLRLIGFDSFQGMPSDGDRDDVWTWQPGQLYSDLRLTRANLKRLGVPRGRVQLVPGWYEDSLTPETRTRLGLERASIVMVDCVLESSTRVALDFCTPLIRDRTVIFFDDWSASDLADRDLGEARAFREWLAAHPELTAEERPELGYEKDSQAFLVTRRPDAGAAGG